MTPEDTPVCLDVMLGGLKAPLRMIGYDTAYALDRGIEADRDLIELAESEARVLVTRDGPLSDRFDRSVLLYATDPTAQLRELEAAGFELSLAGASRCSACNGSLRRVRDGPGPDEGPDPTVEPVFQCRDCGQHYWRGSHWADLERRLENR
jgi:uncharacterized protein with PIN domain